MRRFYAETFDLTDSTALISDPDARHIRTVLRLKTGEPVAVFDGQGTLYSARIIQFLPGHVKVELLDRLSAAESPVHITVAQAYLKENKMDRLVRQLTEMGMSAWVPFISERSVPRPDQARLEGRRSRWQKIAQESLKQCRRARMPEIGKLATFDAVLESAHAADLRIMFWENATASLRLLADSARLPQAVRSVFLLVGPEGGFTQQEVDRAAAGGFHSILLGPRILRAETAATAACALVQYLFGDMG